MATNFVQPGVVIDYTAGADISSGDGVVIGTLLGVALTDIANGATGAVAVAGVFELPKVSADVLAIGTLHNWSNANGVQIAAGDLDDSVVIVEAAGNGDTTVKAMLNGLPGSVEVA